MSSSRTYGAEIEFEGLAESAAELLGNDIRYKVEDDGSTRGYCYELDGVPVIVPRKIKLNKHREITGVRRVCHKGLEIVIQPYEYDDMRKVMERVASIYGSVPQTERTSIHIHVNVRDKPWTYVQRLMRWFYFLEAPLYRIASGGVQHRGTKTGWYKGEDGQERYEQNDYRFARPLSQPISIGYQERGRAQTKKKHLVEVDKLLNAANATEFVSSWGRLDQFWNIPDKRLGHYVPHRLHGINLIAVLRQGTIEWRLFDALYQHAPVFLDVVKAIHDLAEVGDPTESLSEPMVLGSAPSSFDAMAFSKLLDVDIFKLWGNNWQLPCTKDRYGHYVPQMTIPESAPLQPVTNNAGVTDIGDANYTLYSAVREGRMLRRQGNAEMDINDQLMRAKLDMQRNMNYQKEMMQHRVEEPKEGFKAGELVNFQKVPRQLVKVNHVVEGAANAFGGMNKAFQNIEWKLAKQKDEE